MSETDSVQRKPRLWLRILTVLIGVIAIAGTLGYIKYTQILEQIAMGSMEQPPTSVTVAEAMEQIDAAADPFKVVEADGTVIGAVDAPAAISVMIGRSTK